MILTIEQARFQSHIGAIRMTMRYSVEEVLKNFNPTLVQLEYG